MLSVLVAFLGGWLPGIRMIIMGMGGRGGLNRYVSSCVFLLWFSRISTDSSQEPADTQKAKRDCVQSGVKK